MKIKVRTYNHINQNWFSIPNPNTCLIDYRQVKIAQKVVPLLLQSAKANNQQLAKKMRFPKFRKSVAPSPGPSPSRCQSTAGRPPTWGRGRGWGRSTGPSITSGPKSPLHSLSHLPLPRSVPTLQVRIPLLQKPLRNVKKWPRLTSSMSPSITSR